MKKSALVSIATLLIAGATITILAQTTGQENATESQLKEWEQLAEQGDTAAMHRLIEFYDENAEYYIIRELTEAEKQHCHKLGIDNATDTAEIVVNNHYSDRLEKWLEKGTAMNDPVALFTKGMRIYYDDEANAIVYLSKAAMMNYPEAVSEMRSIEPDNQIWQHKADSLQIDSANFPSIQDE